MGQKLITTAVLSAALASVVTYVVVRQDPVDQVEAVIDAGLERPGITPTEPAMPRTGQYDAAGAAMDGKPPSAFADDAGDAQRAQAQLAALTQAFQREPVDPAWSPATERHLSKTMSSNIMVDTEIVPDQLDVECRSSLCRVKARFGKYNDAADWGMMLVTAAGDTFGKAMPTVTPGPDGQAYLEMYALRK